MARQIGRFLGQLRLTTQSALDQLKQEADLKDINLPDLRVGSLRTQARDYVRELLDIEARWPTWRASARRSRRRWRPAPSPTAPPATGPAPTRPHRSGPGRTPPPASPPRSTPTPPEAPTGPGAPHAPAGPALPAPSPRAAAGPAQVSSVRRLPTRRSEERRVGKECRSRW